MASELINKYYNDIVVNKNEFTTEIHDALCAILDADIDELQAFVRRDFLLSTYHRLITFEDQTAHLGEFQTCEPDARYRVVRDANSWTVTITSWDEFNTFCLFVHPGTAGYEYVWSAKDRPAVPANLELCYTFHNALRLITAVNGTTETRYCINLRFDKRTLGLYWQIPPAFHWEHRKICNFARCACCTGHLEWTPIFANRHDGWHYYDSALLGHVAREFFQDFIRTHDMITARYGSHIYPRVAAPAPEPEHAEPAAPAPEPEHAEPAAPAPEPEHDDEPSAGKRARDDEPTGPHKVRVDENFVVDLTTDDDEDDA